MTHRPDTYRAVHVVLWRTRGFASDHTCSCGKPAFQWAYQFTGEELRSPDGGFPHSTNPDDYKPMCRKCHYHFDIENDPVMAEHVRKWRSRNGAKAARRRRRCLECGLVSNPGSVGVHQKSTGHSGYEEKEED